MSNHDEFELSVLCPLLIAFCQRNPLSEKVTTEVLTLKIMLFTILFIVFLLIGLVIFLIRKSFGICHSNAKLEGKTVIVTGANTGIGKETAKDLAGRGATVVLACRNTEKGEKARQYIETSTGNRNVVVQKLDLASLVSVRTFVKHFQETHDSLDILINNAGIMCCPKWETEDGFDMQIGTNHLGHFLLTNLLLDMLKKSPTARIVNVSSIAHFATKHLDVDDLNFKKRPFGPFKAYAESKLENILFTKELAQRLKGTTVTTYSVHPGFVNTELVRYISDTWPIAGRLMPLWPMRFVCKTPEEGAQTSIYCAVTQGIEEESGSYYSDCSRKKSSKLSNDKALAGKLWDVSSEMVDL